MLEEETWERKILNRLFPLILTDNGSEFADPQLFEYECRRKSGEQGIYYCAAEAFGTKRRTGKEIMST
jgi:hypothetical protein